MWKSLVPACVALVALTCVFFSADLLPGQPMLQGILSMGFGVVILICVNWSVRR